MNKLTLRLVSTPIVWLSLWSLVVQPSFSQTKASDPPRISYKAQLSKTENAIEPSKNFSFEESNDLVSQALTTLVSTTPTGSPSPDRASQQIYDAKGLLSKYSRRASHILIKELRQLDIADISGHIGINSLLRQIPPTGGVIKQLGRIINGGKANFQNTITPSSQKKRKNEKADTPILDQSEKSDIENPDITIRRLAVATLYTYAKQGSESAKKGLLNSLKSPYQSIRIYAIDLYYKVNTSRLIAKAGMQPLLKKNERYLLNRR
jgi:hypothetical protein